MTQELTKLAPAAQATVDKLKQLKPVFEEIRLSVQQALFQGVPDELQRLSDAWKEPLKNTLTSYASTVNGLFLNLGSSVRNSSCSTSRGASPRRSSRPCSMSRP
ncbi:hypothetical protein Drose_01635 [Dactylosporangium roseum]|uniref:Uncharacterized protein n=1 Tax=Dactylosporangium roseum TaxID=47989 RepID=A0ABY5Z8L9_9ACTN|nr:hypothetical protein [Dactylosporangium roseum]UWZ37053.1 hypothetical protein Drose_01635 [Dactylosporangium roseum]